MNPLENLLLIGSWISFFVALVFIFNTNNLEDKKPSQLQTAFEAISRSFKQEIIDLTKNEPVQEIIWITNLIQINFVLLTILIAFITTSSDTTSIQNRILSLLFIQPIDNIPLDHTINELLKAPHFEFKDAITCTNSLFGNLTYEIILYISDLLSNLSTLRTLVLRVIFRNFIISIEQGTKGSFDITNDIYGLYFNPLILGVTALFLYFSVYILRLNYISTTLRYMDVMLKTYKLLTLVQILVYILLLTLEDCSIFKNISQLGPVFTLVIWVFLILGLGILGTTLALTKNPVDLTKTTIGCILIHLFIQCYTTLNTITFLYFCMLFLMNSNSEPIFFQNIIFNSILVVGFMVLGYYLKSLCCKAMFLWQYAGTNTYFLVNRISNSLAEQFEKTEVKDNVVMNDIKTQYRNLINALRDFINDSYNVILKVLNYVKSFFVTKVKIKEN